jgi:calcineurin-like phosphoesterase family protein
MLKIKTKLPNGVIRHVWVTSDIHYNHVNIITKLSTWAPGSGANRDFNSLEEYNDTLVNNINSCVGENDILFLLGDVAFGGFDYIRVFRERIICKEIHLVLGNHDDHIRKNTNNLQSYFTSVNVRLNVEIDKNVFVMDHYPIREWEKFHKGWFMLYGHQHNSPDTRFSNGDTRSMDIGLEGHPEFRPYHINEIIELLQDKPILQHH